MELLSLEAAPSTGGIVVERWQIPTQHLLATAKGGPVGRVAPQVEDTLE